MLIPKSYMILFIFIINKRAAKSLPSANEIPSIQFVAQEFTGWASRAMVGVIRLKMPAWDQIFTCMFAFLRRLQAQVACRWFRAGWAGIQWILGRCKIERRCWGSSWRPPTSPSTTPSTNPQTASTHPSMTLVGGPAQNLGVLDFVIDWFMEKLLHR